jgi:hypothetical protein
MIREKISLTRGRTKNISRDKGIIERANTRFAPTMARKPASVVGANLVFARIFDINRRTCIETPTQHHTGGAQC